MTRELGGHTVVVTGAAGGIGSAIAETLGEAGADVVLADIKAEAASALALTLTRRGLLAVSAEVDISDPVSTAKLARTVNERSGRIDTLVACAGIDAPRGRAWELNEDDWRRVIDVDLSGAWWTIRAFLPAFMRQQTGRIIIISSVAARVGEAELSVAYNAAKAGLVGLTIGLAAQLEPHGIRVNAVAPGPTGTGEPMTSEERTAYLASHPLGIVGPDPVARACLYLAGHGGAWISGSVMNVSGGMLRGW